MNQSNQQNSAMVVGSSVAVVNDEPPKIFKLNIYCLDQIFDYLVLHEIYAIGETCKVMQQMVGHYLHKNGFEDISEPKFDQFSKRLRIRFPMQRMLKAKLFPLFKQVNLSGYGSYNFGTQLPNVQDILINVEILDLQHLALRDKYYKRLLNCCIRLKYLRVRCDNLRRVEITLNWLQSNSTVERLQLQICVKLATDYSESYNKLISFLEQSQNVKHLFLYAVDLWKNRNSFAESNIQLDSLVIDLYDYSSSTNVYTADGQFADLLIKLYERGFYKNLQLNVDSSFPELLFINKVASISGLQNIDFPWLDRSFDLSPFVHVKRLSLTVIPGDANMDILAQKLVNLEKLYVGCLDNLSEAIVPFIRHSRKLKKFGCPSCDRDQLENNILDLHALNIQRQKLNGARKVSLLFYEYVYLSTKWAMGNCNFSLVEIKRITSTSQELDLLNNLG